MRRGIRIGMRENWVGKNLNEKTNKKNLKKNKITSKRRYLRAYYGHKGLHTHCRGGIEPFRELECILSRF